MGYAGAESAPAFSDVEIGGGRIMGMETSADNPGGVQFGMYSAEQYMAPGSSYETVTAADGSSWYKQYARDAVEKTPYMAPDGSIAYNESIVQKLPDMPRRKRSAYDGGGWAIRCHRRGTMGKPGAPRQYHNRGAGCLAGSLPFGG